MPVRESKRASRHDPWAHLSGPLADSLLIALYVIVPLLGVAFMAKLAWDAFHVSTSAGFRSLCAAFLPVTVGAYAFRMQKDWLAAVERIPEMGVGVGAAIGTLGVIVAVSSGSGASVFPQFTLSLVFAALLVLRMDPSQGFNGAVDRKLIHAMAVSAITAMVYGVLALGG